MSRASWLCLLHRGRSPQGRPGRAGRLWASCCCCGCEIVNTLLSCGVLALKAGLEERLRKGQEKRVRTAAERVCERQRGCERLWHPPWLVLTLTASPSSPPTLAPPSPPRTRRRRRPPRHRGCRRQHQQCLHSSQLLEWSSHHTSDFNSRHRGKKAAHQLKKGSNLLNNFWGFFKILLFVLFYVFEFSISLLLL